MGGGGVITGQTTPLKFCIGVNKFTCLRNKHVTDISAWG